MQNPLLFYWFVNRKVWEPLILTPVMPEINIHNVLKCWFCSCLQVIDCHYIDIFIIFVVAVVIVIVIIFADYLCSIFNSSSSLNFWIILILCYLFFLFHVFLTQDVKLASSHFSSLKSIGLDEIPSFILRGWSEIFIPPSKLHF